jgi:GT2 family glycosyltransferase
MTKMLKLSVIIPTLNRPDDLEKTLECLLVQDFKSFEVILVDQSDNDKHAPHKAAESEYITNIYKNK